MAREQGPTGVIDRAKAARDKAVNAWNAPHMQAMKDELVDAADRNPAALALVWGMTAGRPVVGGWAASQARKGHYMKAAVGYGVAAALDLEGYPARHWDVTSELGGFADPVGDGGLRGEYIIGLGPDMPATATVIAAAEIYNLKLNATIQKGRKKSWVPFKAKAGTFVQGVGVVAFCHGKENDNRAEQIAGKALMLAGTAARVDVYKKEYDRIMAEPKQ